MKNYILSLITIVGFATAATAQSKGNVEFGYNVGLNSSFISDSWGSSDIRTGFNAGVSADFYFSDSWSVKAKVAYDKKGWNNDFITVDGNLYRTNFALDYITVPVMANWHFGNTKNWYVNFGPYVGFLVNAEETALNNDVKDMLNSTDWGLAFGLGVKIPLSNYIKLFIEYDVQSGFTDVFKDNYNYGSNFSTTRGALNVGLNLML
ncbi:outer membrane beta-barrel protein [Flavobacterium sp. Sd200]|uniref:porin family protein n=1 Tax=Flavobacterium sp. Sd200 TaxID=2692211 RepID=UPI00136A8226|nr:porin family protein [Flavobacterium sp. Sd200]MXN93133.1 outer membrane beta-barrel protein [Flavobacterium sp. Sd200]